MNLFSGFLKVIFHVGDCWCICVYICLYVKQNLHKIAFVPMRGGGRGLNGMSSLECNFFFLTCSLSWFKLGETVFLSIEYSHLYHWKTIQCDKIRWEHLENWHFSRGQTTELMIILLSFIYITILLFMKRREFRPRPFWGWTKFAKWNYFLIYPYKHICRNYIFLSVDKHLQSC